MICAPPATCAGSYAYVLHGADFDATFTFHEVTDGDPSSWSDVETGVGSLALDEGVWTLTAYAFSCAYTFTAPDADGCPPAASAFTFSGSSGDACESVTLA